MWHSRKKRTLIAIFFFFCRQLAVLERDGIHTVIRSLKKIVNKVRTFQVLGWFLIFF